MIFFEKNVSCSINVVKNIDFHPHGGYGIIIAMDYISSQCALQIKCVF
jgi:hypothetical protein